MNKPLIRNLNSSNRQNWIQVRALMEQEKFKYNKYGKRKKQYWNLIEYLIPLFGRFLKLIGLFQKGVRNSMDVVVKQINLEFDDLPDAFDRYKILHLTDLHLDNLPGIEEVISERIGSLSYDLCVMTGDYREALSGGFQEIINPMKHIVSSLQAPDGI